MADVTQLQGFCGPLLSSLLTQWTVARKNPQAPLSIASSPCPHLLLGAPPLLPSTSHRLTWRSGEGAPGTAVSLHPSYPRRADREVRSRGRHVYARGRWRHLGSRLALLRGCGGGGGQHKRGCGWHSSRGLLSEEFELAGVQVDRAALDWISDGDPKFDFTQECKQLVPIVVIFYYPSRHVLI